MTKKTTQTQTTETTEQKPEAPKPVQCVFTMQAARFQDAVKAVEAVSGYSLEAEEHAEAYLHITENGIECAMMDKSREIY